MLTQIDSPTSLLATLSTSKGKPPRLIILSGPPGAGKSSWCMQLVQEATSLSFVVAGLISAAIFDNGDKIGINLVDQFSGECRRLAVRHDGGNDGYRTEQWVLDPGTLAWGNQQLRAIPPCDIVILDELGPEELARGRGLVAGMELIESRQIPLVIAVVRPKLLPIAENRWPWGQVFMLAPEQAVEEA